MGSPLTQAAPKKITSRSWCWGRRRATRPQINGAIWHVEEERAVAWHENEPHVARQLLDIAPLDKLRVALQLVIDDRQSFCIGIGAEFDGLRITFGSRNVRVG